MDEKYPIGKYIEQPFSPDKKEEWLLSISTLPTRLEYAVTNLDLHQLSTPYREGGWTVQQVVHHVADSHMNAFNRFKLALTEHAPIIKPYNQDAYAKLADTSLPVNISITLLHALHTRWVAVLENMPESDFQRTVIHPEYNKEMSLWYLLGNYAWHGDHHTAHINKLRDKMGW